MKSSSSGGSKFGFVRRVLSRTSSHSRSASKSSNSLAAATAAPGSTGMDIHQQSSTPRSSAKFQSELLLLKSQIESLQISVHHMQTDNVTKDKALAAATREKEQMSVDLKKQKRSNVNLRQQLEDERSFYYKEKEQFCHQMNSAKKNRHQNKDDSSGPPVRAQKEIAELKNTLNQTVEANYNLSVKFLRMKNTKLGLKKQLAVLGKQHEESSKYCTGKVEQLRQHMDSLVQEQFYKPIPPSSKKYLHLLKNNGTLIHENLQLQLEVDRLHAEIEKNKVAKLRNETNSKLKLIHHDDITNSNTNTNSKSSICSKCKLKIDSSRTSVTEKTGRSVKSYSRSSQTPSMSTTRSRHSHSRSHHHHHHQMKESSKSINSSLNASDLSVEVIKIEKHGKLTASTIDNASETLQKTQPVQSKYDLMTVSNSYIDMNSSCHVDQRNQSNCSLDSSNNSAMSKSGMQVKSAPEILRSLDRPDRHSSDGPREKV